MERCWTCGCCCMRSSAFSFSSSAFVLCNFSCLIVRQQEKNVLLHLFYKEREARLTEHCSSQTRKGTQNQRVLMHWWGIWLLCQAGAAVRVGEHLPWLSLCMATPTPLSLSDTFACSCTTEQSRRQTSSLGPYPTLLEPCLNIIKRSSLCVNETQV